MPKKLVIFEEDLLHIQWTGQLVATFYVFCFLKFLFWHAYEY
jgi:hypothetical protein